MDKERLMIEASRWEEQAELALRRAEFANRQLRLIEQELMRICPIEDTRPHLTLIQGNIDE